MKGVMGCGNQHVDESTLEKAFVMAWSGILENKEYFLRKWEAQEKREDLLEVYRAKDFRKLTDSAVESRGIETDLILRVLNCISVFKNGELLVMFLDGTEIECKNE